MSNYYKTFREAQGTKFAGEENTEPSQTIPGEAETIAEMFRKFQNGIPIRSRPRSEINFMEVDHDDVNFHLLKPQSDPLTAKETVIKPKTKQSSDHGDLKNLKTEESIVIPPKTD